MVRTGTRSSEEVDGAKKDPTAVAVMIAVTVAETLTMIRTRTRSLEEVDGVKALAADAGRLQ